MLHALRNFVPPKGKRVLFEYGKDGAEPRELTPKVASAESDTFEVERLEARSVERYFAALEGKVRPAFALLRNHQQLDEFDRRTLSTFIALSFVRSSKRQHENERVRSLYTIEAFEEWLRKPSTRIAYLLTHEDWTAAAYDYGIKGYIEGLRRGEFLLPKLPEKRYLSLIKYAESEWRDSLFDSRWHVEIAGGDDFFIVGDEAVTCRIPNQLFNPDYVGITNFELGIEIAFPLSRKRCLVMDARGSESKMDFVTVGTDRVTELNLRSIMCAHRVVFSPYKTKVVEDLIEKVGQRGVNLLADITLDQLFETTLAKNGFRF